MLFAVAAVALSAGCGGQAKKPSAPISAAASGPSTVGAHTVTTSTIPPGQRLRGDGDADNPGDLDGNGDVDPEDNDADYPVPGSYKLPDDDDKAVLAYGRRAGNAEAKAIAAVVKRYYAYASAGDGAGACRLLLPSIALTVPEDYGRTAGVSESRGTCQTIMSALFRHAREQLAEAIAIVAVRVSGDNAEVVIGSRRMPAASLSLTRRNGAWRLRQVLGQTLP